MKLFCFPYAGGVSAMIYSKWKGAGVDDVEIVPVEIPDRFSKGSPNYQSIRELAVIIKEKMMDDFVGEFAFWGHSLGAILAFELARILESQNLKMIFLSGTKPFHLKRCEEPIHTYDDKTFVKEIYAMNGTQKGSLDNDEIRKVFLPILRHDFKLVYDYVYQPSDKLTIPIVSMVGDQEDITTEELKSWPELTTKWVKNHVLEGDHFFIFDHVKTIGKIISRSLNDEGLYDENTNYNG